VLIHASLLAKPGDPRAPSTSTSFARQRRMECAYFLSFVAECARSTGFFTFACAAYNLVRMRNLTDEVGHSSDAAESLFERCGPWKAGNQLVSIKECRDTARAEQLLDRDDTRSVDTVVAQE
jgi:hypothetical protein